MAPQLLLALFDLRPQGVEFTAMREETFTEPSEL